MHVPGECPLLHLAVSQPLCCCQLWWQTCTIGVYRMQDLTRILCVQVTRLCREITGGCEALRAAGTLLETSSRSGREQFCEQTTWGCFPKVCVSLIPSIPRKELVELQLCLCTGFLVYAVVLPLGGAPYLCFSIQCAWSWVQLRGHWG